jgi:rhodanese-related sulfurtransferase
VFQILRAIALTSIIQLVRLKFPAVRPLSTSTLAQWLEQTDCSNRSLLLDARDMDEFNVSHLPNAQHIDPKSPNWSLLSTYLKDTSIVVYCSVGYRSAQLAQQLQEQGFSNVWNLEGSIFQWANEGRPLYNSEEKLTTDVHPYNAQWGKLLKPELRHERIDTEKTASSR